ncbi:hypothetical protein ACWCOP_11915 [Maricaulaceae bacterium MS644]
MTDFEKGILFVEFLGAANFIFANYMTLLFATITASWFLAARMSRAVAAMFLILFTLGAMGVGSGVVFAFADFGHLGRHIAQTSAPGGDLAWLGPMRGPGEQAANLGVVAGVLVVGGYLGALAFFFISRYGRGRADARADVPVGDDS